MTELNPLPEKTLVVAADAAKALLLRNTGVGRHLGLVVDHVEEAPPNPRSSEQGTDRPGKTEWRGRSSAMEETDWAEQAEKRFAEGVAGLLDRRVREGDVEAIALIVAPKFLGDLRRHLSARVRALVIKEMAKDLAHGPIPEIERALGGEG